MGAMGLGNAPKYSAGVQTAIDIFSDGNLRLGVGTGLRFAKPLWYISRETTQKEGPSGVFLGDGTKVYPEGVGVFAPFFLSAGWYPEQIGDAVHPFVRLDTGYLLSIGKADSNRQLSGFFLEPQVGVVFQNGLYAAAGAWLQQASHREQTTLFNPEGTTFSSSSNTYRNLVPSISLRIGMKF